MDRPEFGSKDLGYASDKPVWIDLNLAAKI
jgi:hypothetical protein